MSWANLTKVLPDFENKQKAEQLKSNLLNLVSEINEVQDQLRQAKQKGENEDAMFLEQRVQDINKEFQEKMRQSFEIDVEKMNFE